MGRNTCSPVELDGNLAQDTKTRYLGTCLDGRLFWKKRIIKKNNELKLIFSKIY